MGLPGWEVTIRRSYDPKWAKFLRFCDEDSKNAYDAKKFDVIAYIG